MGTYIAKQPRARGRIRYLCRTCGRTIYPEHRHKLGKEMFESYNCSAECYVKWTLAGKPGKDQLPAIVRPAQIGQPNFGKCPCRTCQHADMVYHRCRLRFEQNAQRGHIGKYLKTDIAPLWCPLKLIHNTAQNSTGRSIDRPDTCDQ